MQEMWKIQVLSLGWEDPLEQETANPFQYSCLENPMDRGAWWATVHGVSKSQTQLSTHTYCWAFLKLLSLHQAMGWVGLLTNPLKADSQFAITLWAPLVFSLIYHMLVWRVRILDVEMNPLLLRERVWICGSPLDCGMLCQAWGLWQDCI